MTLTIEKVDEIVLALMYLTLHDSYRAWKGFDWETLDRLYEKGLNSDSRKVRRSRCCSPRKVLQNQRACLSGISASRMKTQDEPF